MIQPDLLHDLSSYPDSPGYRKTDTSLEAAEMVAETTPMIRDKVLKCLQAHPHGLTTEEIADKLNIAYATIQPRTSELRKTAQIIDSRDRRKNGSGRKAIVWKYDVTHDLISQENHTAMKSTLNTGQ